jgi:tetratricopeptide (TPR) repeat protein
MPDVDEAVDAALGRITSGQQDEGKREIEQLFDKHPDYHTTNYGMGVVLAHFESRPSDAIPYFENAVDIFPIFGSAHFNLGNCYLKTYKIEKAIVAFRSARKYGEDEEVRDRARELLSWIEQHVSTPLMPTLDDYIQNATVFGQAFDCLQAHRFEQAIFLFKRVLEKEPRCVQAFGNMALAYGFLGKKALAMECFDQALALDPDYEPAVINKFMMMKDMEEGQAITPTEILETEYYSTYRGEKKGSYIQDVLQDSQNAARRAE